MHWCSRSRVAYWSLLEQAWTDAFSAHSIITFWDYRWARGARLRLDHILLSGRLSLKLVDATVDREVRGREGASDHPPVWVELWA